ncbi:MAG: ATP-binding protein [Acidobacteriia bacterium]|nr:ATP-binding protein [Terriglobia bacterium]
MKIRAFAAGNYKSIYIMEPFALTNGFNIVIGQNAAGKTALLEILSLQLSPKPHRSEKTVPNRGDITEGHSMADVELEFANSEMKRLLRNTRANVNLPVPAAGSDLAAELGVNIWDGPAVDKLIRWWLNQPIYVFKLKFSSSGEVLSNRSYQSFVTYPLLLNSSRDYLHIPFQLDLAENLVLSGTRWNSSLPDLGANLANNFRQLIYRFSSERPVKARSPHGINPQLASNAENLAEVLHVLQSNAVVFEEFNSLVSEIFPQVKWVSTRPITSGNEVVIWNLDKAKRRDDLAVPLDETGTGIGQVLAILYVVFTSNEPSAIIIDEPQSFLHPASAVKLIQVLRRYSQHQFILATHSPSIISAAGPSNIIALTYDGETHVETFDLTKTASFQSFLDATGLEMQDTFGADRILWVEGPTEAKAFPEIIERLCNAPLMGTRVLPVSATGDLEGKDAVRVFSMYRTLTQGNPLLPPALAFILDRETRNQQQINELVRQSNDKAMFLPRRMFENYLLRPVAIAAVMNSLQGFSPEPITEAVIQDNLNRMATDARFFTPLTVQDQWEATIHAGRVLEFLFGDLSEHRVEYLKTRDSVALAKWLLENHPEDLSEVAGIIKTALTR